jgi:hypothetical protein
MQRFGGSVILKGLKLVFDLADQCELGFDIESKLEAKFQEFHKQNPQVYLALRERALQLKRKGWSHYGIKAIVEVVRFHRALETTDPNFKLNNNYSSRYARILMEQESELKEFFQTRELKS